MQIIGASLACPLQIEKKQIILQIPNTNKKIPAAKGTIIVQHKTALTSAVNTSTTKNLRLCLTWNATYADVELARSAMMIPATPKR